MKRRKSESVDISVEDFVPIVGDASIAGRVAEGVNIPLLILDTSRRPEVEELIRVQALLPPGDVAFRWGGSVDDPDVVMLVLDFERPIETRVALRFSIERQGILVDAALKSRAVYLQAGRPGDRLVHDLNRPKMLLDLPDTGFRPKWDRLLLERMTDVVAKRGGLSRNEAKLRAELMIAEMRQLTSFRMPRQ
jgi:hypothetical protein